ncbi:MAG: sensor histidine kinase [Lachnospiraceae bacterium]|nr:sensor histidine kinase [Lachnospiraceae bacterium]
MLQIGSAICEIALWLGGIIFLHREEKRKNFSVRIWISSIIALVLSIVLSIYYGGDFPFPKIVLQIFSTIALIGYMLWNWKVTPSVAIYNFIWTRIVWWLIIETWQFATVILERVVPLSVHGKCISLVVLFMFSYALCDRTICRWIPENGQKRIGPRKLTAAILICVIFELLAYRPELLNVEETNLLNAFPLFLLQWISAIVLYLQNELFRKSSMKQELELVNLLLEKEHEQYRLSKENIAIINQKCHDLKHQIRAVRKVTEEERDQYLREVEESISIYESIVQTGNEVLDTILTEKSLYCRERGITISCVADGKLLQFINPMDLYSLFGNALDNSIEAVEQFEEEEKRQIDVLIHRQQNFLMVNIINPVKDVLVMENEIPITTKRDRNLHGFGLRSMKYIVKKYDGFFNITQEDGCFSLKFLFPIRE